MSIITNKKHFLHEHLTFLESVGVEGKNGGWNHFLSKFNVPSTGSFWIKDHSNIDWDKTKNHHQFFFDYVDNEYEIMNWLATSNLVKSEFLYTWLSWEDPIIKVKTTDFIKNWNEFYLASVDGMVLITTDGKWYVEFTDDWQYHLNSNFEIKPDTEIKK